MFLFKKIIAFAYSIPYNYKLFNEYITKKYFKDFEHKNK